MIYLKLFLTFLQIGAFSFGGGYGMISLIREKVLMHGWLTEEEMLNMIAVAESTPDRSRLIWRPSLARHKAVSSVRSLLRWVWYCRHLLSFS